MARRFRAANDELVAFAECLTDEEWAACCEREGRTIGQVIEHIAAGHLIIGGIVEAMALGLDLPVAARRTAETGARFNARQAQKFAGHTRARGLRALRRNGEVVARFLASLTDEELARGIDTIEGPITTAQEIEGGLFTHLRSHFAAVRESLGSLLGIASRPPSAGGSLDG
jgi:uncharacterized damage-inducible protein DinB